jgi:hypothetical protein
MKTEGRIRRTIKYNPENVNQVFLIENMLHKIHKICKLRKKSNMRETIRKHGLKNYNDLEFLRSINVIDNSRTHGKLWEWVAEQKPSYLMAQELVSKLATYRKNNSVKTPDEEKKVVIAFQRRNLDKCGTIGSEQEIDFNPVVQPQVAYAQASELKQLENLLELKVLGMKKVLNEFNSDLQQLRSKTEYAAKSVSTFRQNNYVEVPVLWGLFTYKAKIKANNQSI